MEIPWYNPVSWSVIAYFGKLEPYRVCRRAFSLRGWSHVTTESVFPRSIESERCGWSAIHGAEQSRTEWAAIESIAGKLGCTAEDAPGSDFFGRPSLR